MMLKPWSNEWPRFELRTEAFYTGTEANVTGLDVDLSIFDAVGRINLKPGSSYSPTIGFELTHFEISSGDAALPDDMTDASVAFGGNFGDVDLGETVGVWQMGYALGVGYSGTNLFEDSDGWYGKADVWAIKPIDKDTRWLVGINYDGNRVFLPDVPLPAVSYFGRASETVTYAVGLPFSRLTYKPDDRWTIDLRSALFFSFNASIRYRATNKLELFAAYVRKNEAFHVSGGAVDHRRFIFTQQRAEVGLNYKLVDNIVLTLAGGLAFGQEFEVGYDTRDTTGLRDLDDSGYVRGGIELRF